MILRVMGRYLEMLSVLPRWLVICAASAMILLLGCVSYVTGPDVFLSPLFIMPIVSVTWVASARWIAPMAMLCGVTMFTSNYLTGAEYTSALVPLWNFGSRFVVLMVVARVVVHLQQTARTAEALARTDALTGVGNVRYFRESAELEIARAQRYDNPLTLAFIDIDNFKRVNDTYGHEIGDRALRAIGHTLQRSVRRTDIVARIGGDEFVVLLTMMPPAESEHFVEQLSQRIRSGLDVTAYGPLTCSIGAVSFETPPDSVDEMLKLADERRYAAKRAGKDTVRHRAMLRPSPVPLIA